ncbi:MAG TPA: pyridoxal-dependent decarboxylase, exosortase A system-associated [Gammaproteobacteria bacterium]|nr:pyridoxal-dependent decarboxylase, exosortase A system-associated [Gammaproteobacteria bacterium]
MTDAPVHAPNLFFPVIDGCLHIGGMPLGQLAEQVGSTPFYAYDRTVMTGRVKELRRHLPRSIDLHYAIKANPMPAVVQHMAGLTDGLDVASARELRTALDTGMDPERISFAGPGKKPEELKCAIAAGVIVNLESFTELDRTGEVGTALGIRPRVAVRVNPDFELKTSGMKMSGGPKPFGVDAEQVPEMLHRIAQMDVAFYGFHIFSGSQNLRAEAIMEAQAQTAELAIRLAEHAPAPIRILNIGGGLGIPYFPGDRRLNVAPIGEHLHTMAERLGTVMPQVQLVLELGRYLVGEAGIYVCRVLDRKISRGRVFLVTDGGLHHHLAASGNFGQVIRKNYPVGLAQTSGQRELEEVSVVGPLCTPLDILADRTYLPQPTIGDLVVVFQSGAYGYSASPLRFLSHPDPVQLVVG